MAPPASVVRPSGAADRHASRVRCEARPTALTMDYRNCSERGDRHPRIAHVDDALGMIENLPSTSHGSKVTALQEHFSNYAVGW